MSYKDNDDVDVNIFMDDPVILASADIEGDVDIDIDIDADTDSINVFSAEYNIPQYANNYYYPNQLAQAYVIPQVYKCGFPPKEALCKGTYFPELYKPYKG